MRQHNTVLVRMPVRLALKVSCGLAETLNSQQMGRNQTEPELGRSFTVSSDRPVLFLCDCFLCYYLIYAALGVQDKFPRGTIKVYCTVLYQTVP